MTKLFKNLKPYKLSIVILLAVLVVQAFEIFRYLAICRS